VSQLHPARPNARVLGVVAGIVIVLMTTVALVVERFAASDAAAPPPDVVTSVPVTTPQRVTTQLERTLAEGDQGDDVRMVQQRLADLRFDPGPIDGVLGRGTVQALWAFEKLVMGVPREKATGTVTPDMWEVMRDDVVIAPRRVADTGRHVEVYLPEQVMVVFLANGQPLLVTHISSGTEQPWCEEVVIDPGEPGNNSPEQIAKGEQLKTGICGIATTTPGVFTFYNRRLGTRETKLGTLYNPVYFNQGLAIHGAILVPLKPASKGCIRIPMSVARYFPSLVEYRDRIYVFDGVKEPEEYGSPLPPADRPDPNYTTVPTTLPVDPMATTTTVLLDPSTATTSDDDRDS
jgi:peptidoglycan hydrolase-like protein with peptidoglycan-binding domain